MARAVGLEAALEVIESRVGAVLGERGHGGAGRAAAGAGGAVVIGVCGGVASGKSTLARALVQRLGGVVLATDDYLPDYDHVPEAERDLPERAHLADLAGHIRVLRSGGEAETPVWSFETHRREGTRRVRGPAGAGGVVVVEGIFALAEPVAGDVDVGVFVEADAGVRRERFIARDAAGERGWGPVKAAAFFDAVAEPTFWARATGYRRRAGVVVEMG